MVRIDGDARAAARSIVEKGFEHHVVLSYGDVAEEIAALANLWQIPLVRL